MNTINEGYQRSIEKINESVIVTLIVGAILGDILRRTFIKAKTKPKLKHYLVAIIRYFSEDGDSDGIDLGIVKKYAYENMNLGNRLEIVTESKKSSIFDKATILKAKKSSTKTKEKFLGKFIATIAKNFNLSKADVDSVIATAKERK